jgi:hypothetical protein
MRGYFSLLAALVLTTALLSTATAQGKPEKPGESSPPTSPSPDPKQAPEDQPSAGKPGAKAQHAATVFMGTIVRGQTGFVLRAADLEYGLDDQSKARRFNGKNVKITGSLDASSNTLHVENIEVSPSL